MKIKVTYEIDIEKDVFIADELEKEQREELDFDWYFRPKKYKAKILEIQKIE